MKIDINMDHEVKLMVEAMDDAFDGAVDEALANFAERQFGDWVTANGGTERSIAEFSNIEDEITERAIEVIAHRWKKAKE